MNSPPINLEPLSRGITSAALDIHPMGVITGYTVLAHELENLETVSGDETLFQAITFTAAGAGVSSAVTWATSGTLASFPHLFVIIVTVCAAVLTASFAGFWWRAHRKRLSVIQKIKASAPAATRYELRLMQPHA